MVQSVPHHGSVGASGETTVNQRGPSNGSIHNYEFWPALNVFAFVNKSFCATTGEAHSYGQSSYVSILLLNIFKFFA